MALSIPSTAGFVAVDTTAPKTITLPLSTDRIGRLLSIKDKTGLAATNNITIQTQGGDTFQNGTTTYTITQPFGEVTFLARPGQWIVQIGWEQIYASTVQANFFIGDGSRLTNLSTGGILVPNLLSTVAGLGSIGYASTTFVTGQISSFSTALGAVGAGNLTTANLTSTVAGLGTIGYASTTYVTGQISSFSTAIASAIGSGGITTTNLTSTVGGLGRIYLSSIPAVLSTSQLLTSSLVTSTLTTATLSTQQVFTSSITGNVSQFQNLSSLALYVSSFYSQAVQMTPMFITF